MPQNGIYAVFHSGTDDFLVAKDQTVFHITDYFNGFWTGVVTTKLTHALVPSCQYVLGNVTPEGNIWMTMYNATTGAAINNPIGMMVKKHGQWTMENQMTAPSQSGSTLSHWAYMVQSKPGDHTWNSLPFARQSVPEFMSACPSGPPINKVPTPQSGQASQPPQTTTATTG